MLESQENLSITMKHKIASFLENIIDGWQLEKMIANKSLKVEEQNNIFIPFRDDPHNISDNEIIKLGSILNKYSEISQGYEFRFRIVIRKDKKYSWNNLMEILKSIHTDLIHGEPLTQKIKNIFCLDLNDSIHPNGCDNPKYSLHSAGLKAKIIRNISAGYQTAELLRRKVKTPTQSSLSKAISEINRNFKIKFGIKEKIIINKASSGYCVNPLYEIIIE